MILEDVSLAELEEMYGGSGFAVILSSGVEITERKPCGIVEWQDGNTIQQTIDRSLSWCFAQHVDGITLYVEHAGRRMRKRFDVQLAPGDSVQVGPSDVLRV